MASLTEIRARLAAQENKSNKSFTPGDSPVYPHWNIKEGETAIIRFLEDGNTDNAFFWVERAMFKLPFNGIKGDPTANNVMVQVPCMEMYGEKCAVLDEVRTWFKDTSMEEMGRKYWKKRSYLFQGFVHSNPIDGDGPENPIRRFMISPQIFTLIKNSLMDPEIENLPTDGVAGLDFRINKQSKGGYADYSSSTWARKESSLTDEEHAAIAKYGTSDLASFLPTKPTEEVQKVIREMFEASVDGEQYDPERWGAYYVPPGVSKTGDNTATKAVPSAPAEAKVTKIEEPADPVKAASTEIFEAKEEVVVEPVVVEPVVVETKEPVAEAAESGDKAADILAMIRNRQKD